MIYHSVEFYRDPKVKWFRRIKDAQAHRDKIFKRQSKKRKLDRIESFKNERRTLISDCSVIDSFHWKDGSNDYLIFATVETLYDNELSSSFLVYSEENKRTYQSTPEYFIMCVVQQLEEGFETHIDIELFREFLSEVYYDKVAVFDVAQPLLMGFRIPNSKKLK